MSRQVDRNALPSVLKSILRVKRIQLIRLKEYLAERPSHPTNVLLAHHRQSLHEAIRSFEQSVLEDVSWQTTDSGEKLATTSSAHQAVVEGVSTPYLGEPVGEATPVSCAGPGRRTWKENREEEEELPDQLCFQEPPEIDADNFRLLTASPFLNEKRRCFSLSLSKPGLSIIAEVKRRSPSAACLSSIESPADCATTYCSSGSDAISCLTDTVWFGGSLEDLRSVSVAAKSWAASAQSVAAGQSHSRIGILRKDFTIDVVQIAEAKVYGASAILLMVNVLGVYTGLFMQLCSLLGIEFLVEVHTEEELAVALRAKKQLYEFVSSRPEKFASEDSGPPAVIIGVNNRDLHTLRVDLCTAERILPSLGGPEILIAESGVLTGEDALRMRRAGADGVLVGESLVKAYDAGKAAQLLRSFKTLPKPLVKICGASTPEMAEAILSASASAADRWRRTPFGDAGERQSEDQLPLAPLNRNCWLRGKAAHDVCLVDILGIVFAEKSPRFVNDLQIARQIVQKAERRHVPVWGVFVAEEGAQYGSAAAIAAVAQQTGLQGVQLCGSDGWTQLRELHQLLPRNVVRVLSLPVNEDGSMSTATQVVLNKFSQFTANVLFETQSAEVPRDRGDRAEEDSSACSPFCIMFEGTAPGTGKAFCWRNLRVKRELPVVVAGGLAKQNISRVLRECYPNIVDVSSSVETTKGVKDPRLVSEFLEELNIAVSASS